MFASMVKQGAANSPVGVAGRPRQSLVGAPATCEQRQLLDRALFEMVAQATCCGVQR